MSEASPAPAPAASSEVTPPPAPRRNGLIGRLRARPALLAAIIYAVLSVVMVAPGLLPGHALSGSDYLYNDAPWQSSRPASVPGLGANFELADAADVFQPFLRYTRSQLPSIPLWNPYISGGRPYLANAQSAIFTPFNLPAYLLPFWTSLAVTAAIKLFIGAFGAYALGRVLGMRFGGALFAGLVFAFGTFFVIWLAWPLTNIFPLIPWLLVITELLVRRPGPLPAVGVAALVSLAYFGGHPETSFHTLFVTVVFFLFRLGLRARAIRAGPRTLVRPTVIFGLSLVAGTALAAIMLIPFAQLLAHSSDLAQRSADGQGFWPRKYIGALFLHDYWGRATQDSNIEPFMQLRGWYAGAITLMLAAAALIIRPTLERIAIAVFALFVVCMVLGLNPVFNFVISLPGFSAAHNERLLIDFLLCLALLAGWGLDDLTTRDATVVQRRRLLLAVGAGIFLVPFAWMGVKHTISLHNLGTALNVAWGLVHPPPIPGNVLNPGGTPQAAIVHMSALLQWVPLAGIGLALIALRLRGSRRLPVLAFVAAVLVLIAADLFRANMGFNPSIPVSNANPPVTGSIHFLRTQRPNRFVGVSTNITFQPLPADLAMTYGLYDARGYDYPAEQRYNTMWRRNVAPGVPDFAQPIETASATPASLRALDLLSVKDLLVDPHYPPLRQPGLQLAYRGHDALVYDNADALPRVFTVDRQQTVASAGAALLASTAFGFDRRHVVVSEHPIAGLLAAGAGPSAAAGTARLLSYGAQRIVTEASVPRRGMLVLTDVYYPGWQVTVDGHSAPLDRVDYLLRGVPLSAGTHRIVFSYQPASVTAGAVVSLVALVALIAVLAAGLLGRRARRRRSTTARLVSA